MPETIDNSVFSKIKKRGAKLIWAVTSDYAKEGTEVVEGLVKTISGMELPEIQKRLDRILNPPREENHHLLWPMYQKTFEYLNQILRISPGTNTTVYLDDNVKLEPICSSLRRNEVEAVITPIRKFSEEMFVQWEDSIVGGLSEFNSTNKKAPMTSESLLVQTVDKIIKLTFKVRRVSDEDPVFALKYADEELAKTAYHVFDDSKIVEGPYPTIQKFLNRIDYPKEFMAFIWKCFKVSDTGRQVAWIQSGGNAGTTTFLKVIQELFGHASAVLPEWSKDSRFQSYALYRKRLVVAPDARFEGLMNNGLLRNITGNDQIQVEEKHKNSFSARCYSRVVVISNDPPQIDITDHATVSRLLLFSVPKLQDGSEDFTIEDSYRKEVFHFLFDCRKIESEICPRGRVTIPIPPSMLSEIETRCIPPELMKTVKFLQNRIEICENEKITDYELISKLKEHLVERGYMSRPEASEATGKRGKLPNVVKKYLFRKSQECDQIKVKSDDDGNIYYAGIRIKVFPDAQI